MLAMLLTQVGANVRSVEEKGMSVSLGTHRDKR